MTSIQEQAVTHALHALVAEVVPPSGLVEEVERRHRRRRRSRGAVVVAAVMVTVTGLVVAPSLWSAVGRDSGGTAGGTTSDPARAIWHARFVRTLVLDEGALRVEPPAGGRPQTSEQQAVATFRSSTHPTVEISDVVVGYGLVTMRPKLANASVTFTRRPAWLVFHSGGMHSCPGRRPRVGSGLPEGRPVFILADSGMEAVSYVGRGSFCGGPPTGPTTRIPYRYESVPWQEVFRTPTAVTVRYLEPACGHLEGGESVSTPRDAQLTLFAAVPMAAIPCPQRGPQNWQAPAPRNGQPLRHAPTGPVAGYVTQLDPTRFDYSRGRGG